MTMNTEAQFFNNILITPYEELLDEQLGLSAHCGGPHWPDWEIQTIARHCRGGHPIDKQPSFKKASESYHDTIAWCGAAQLHYGHQIADFSTRILPSLFVNPDVTLGFAIRQDSNFLATKRPLHTFKEILNWLQVKPERVKIFSQPTMVDRIFVTAQAEQIHGDPPQPEYLNLIDEIVTQNIGRPTVKSETVFVSRAGVAASRLAGESYIERMLSQAGVRVIRPELFPLHKQLELYAQTERLIFTEGSALHTIQLLGHIPAEVYVINRRPQKRLATSAIAPRVQNLEYFDTVQANLLGMNEIGAFTPEKGISLLCEEELLALLKKRLNLKLNHWRSKDFFHARDMDILTWTQTISKTKRPHEHQFALRQSIIETLSNARIEHLKRKIEDLLATSNLAASTQAAPSRTTIPPIPKFNLITKESFSR